MIKRNVITLILAAFALALSSVQVAGAAASGEYAQWLIPGCSGLALQVDALDAVNDTESAIRAIKYVAEAIIQAECECDDAINFAIMYAEDAIRRGITLDAPANGVFYADLLQISVEMAQSIIEELQATQATGEIDPMQPLNVNINFISDEQNVLRLHFPDDVSGMNFDYISVEAEFAAITLYNRFLSGSALRIDRGLPIASGVYAYITMPNLIPLPGVVLAWPLGYMVAYWAVAAFAVILVIWGILASMGKRLRLWVVPLLAVILIAANLWTLGHWPNQSGPNQEVPDYAVAWGPVHFYSVEVMMTPGIEVVLSMPLNGADPEMLMLVNEDGELMLSLYNPFTDTIDARIYSSGKYYLRMIDIRG